MSLSPESADAAAAAAAQLRAFGDFILAHREDITRYWVGAVDRSPRVTSSSGLTFRQLLDHFPFFCSELADILKSSEAGAARQQANRDAASHGRHRWQQGYRLDEVIREVCIIRRDFLTRWLKAFEAEQGRMETSARTAGKRLIHGFFDDVMIDSTLQFVEEHSQEIKESGSELADGRQRTAESTQVLGGRFLALLGHELRTPLTPILFDLASFESDKGNPYKLQTRLARIRHNIHLEAALIDDLLDAARLTEGTLELQLENIDIHALLAAEIAACQFKYVDKQLRLEVQLNAKLTKTSADANRLRRVFATLLTNAANVSEIGTRVMVHSRNTTEGRQIEIGVQDTGEKLDEDVAERVFLPFEPGRRSTFGIGRLGVGRYVAKAVVEAHGGRLMAKRAAARGAMYVVTLPIAGE